jgi:hypothetical protein
MENVPENRDKTGKFIKGVSGNPGGRPTKAKEVKELAETLSIPSLTKAFAIVENENSKDSDKLTAITLILAYAVGKPTQTLDVGNKEGEAFKTSSLTPDQLALIERVAKRVGESE